MDVAQEHVFPWGVADMLHGYIYKCPDIYPDTGQKQYSYEPVDHDLGYPITNFALSSSVGAL